MTNVTSNLTQMENLDDKKINIEELQHIKFEFIKQEYVATLIDPKGFEILKGYGRSNIIAINDLLNNLI